MMFFLLCFTISTPDLQVIFQFCFAVGMERQSQRLSHIDSASKMTKFIAVPGFLFRRGCLAVRRVRHGTLMESIAA